MALSTKYRSRRHCIVRGRIVDEVRKQDKRVGEGGEESPSVKRVYTIEPPINPTESSKYEDLIYTQKWYLTLPTPEAHTKTTGSKPSMFEWRKRRLDNGNNT